MQEVELIPHLFKTEYRKIVSVLCKLFGINNIELAEDITHDTFLIASETWGLKGIPDNPVAWLYKVAKNKTLDVLKRQKNFQDKISPELSRSTELFTEEDIDLSPQNVFDSQLQMMFAICNPAINAEAQIGLSLRILCGFGIEEIADAFLSNKETINKRLFRAKEKLRAENIAIEMPPDHEIGPRLENVLTTLYLLFNEGYYSASSNIKIKKDLCIEAMRLTFLLIENNSTCTPAVNALMALMCFQSSRFDARISETGESILYAEQNRDQWDEDLIERGNYFLVISSQGRNLSRYHLEASIAYWHSLKEEMPNKWDSILQLYNRLLQVNYSPIVALNRTYALAMAYGKSVAIEEAEKLPLDGNHLYHALLGNLYTTVDDEKALDQYLIALKCARTENDKKAIEKHIRELSGTHD